jgi:hypothetical protein
MSLVSSVRKCQTDLEFRFPVVFGTVLYSVGVKLCSEGGPSSV